MQENRLNLDAEHTRKAEEDHLDLLRVIQHVHSYAVTTKSDLAREYADEIACAASRGFISTLVIPGGSLFGKRWKVTVLGLAFLEREAAPIVASEEAAFSIKFQEASEELDAGAAIE